MFTAGAAGLTVALGSVLRDRRRGALIATPLVLGLTMAGHATGLARAAGVSGAIAVAAGAALLAVAVIAALRLDPVRLERLDALLGRVAALLVVITLVLIVPFEVQAAATRGGGGTAEPLPTTTTAERRDVYWLVFDRYGSDRSLELAYGVENDLTPWLEGQGFDVLEDSHANYIRTVLSMATTLQMAHLETIAPAQGPDSRDLAPVIDGLQDSPVVRRFKALGYRYVHVGTFHDPTRTDRAADVNLNLSVEPSDFVTALWDASAGPMIARRLRIGVTGARERQFAYSTFGLDAIEGLRDEPGPKFVTGHVLLPHPPLVFDVDGRFIERAQLDELPFLEQYRRQLGFTNRRIREIVGGLLALPESERPIIILQADEGPYPPSYSRLRRTSTAWAPQATREDLEIKFGILDAWYVPGGVDLELDPDMTAINTFPTLFSRYFGHDVAELPDRIYASHSWTRPYDLTDVTDRLAAP